MKGQENEDTNSDTSDEAFKCNFHPSSSEDHRESIAPPLTPPQLFFFSYSCGIKTRSICDLIFSLFFFLQRLFSNAQDLTNNYENTWLDL